MENLETQVGQIAIVLSGRTQGSVLSNTTINPTEQLKLTKLRIVKLLEELRIKGKCLKRGRSPYPSIE